MLSIDYQVGRTAVTPVANLAPRSIGWNHCKTRFSAQRRYYQKLDLHVGDFVYVEKGGEIIPKIVGVNLRKRNVFATEVQYATHCPECGSELIRFRRSGCSFCPNETLSTTSCGKMIHYVSRKALNIENLGSETIEQPTEKVY